MKKIINILFAAFAITALTMCQKDSSEGEVAPFDIKTAIEVGDIQLDDISQVGAYSDFSIAVDGDWTLSFDGGAEEWIELYTSSTPGISLSRTNSNELDKVALDQPISGSGKTEFMISIAPNPSRDSRSSLVTLETPQGVASMVITQSSAKYSELLYLNMGTSSSTTVATLPKEGIGYADSEFALALSSGSIAQKKELTSSSVAGVYTASGSNYMSISANASLEIKNMICTNSDIYVNFGCRVESGLDAQSLAIQYLSSTEPTDDPSEAIYLDSENITVSTSDNSSWGYISAYIPQSLLTSGATYLSLIISGGSEATLIDDLSILNLPTYIPVATLSIENIAHKRATLTSSCINIDGSEVTDISNHGFRYIAKADKDSGEWTDAPIASGEPFQYTITGMNPRSSYLCQSYIELNDGTTIESVTLEFETTSTPEITIDQVSSAAISTSSIKVVSRVSAMLGEKPIYIAEEYLGNNYAEIKLTDSDDVFTKATIASTEFVELEEYTLVTQIIEGLGEGLTYDIRSAIVLEDDTISSQIVSLTSGVRDFTISTITSEGSLHAGIMNETGIRLIIPIDSDEATVNWVDLTTNHSNLVVAKSVEECQIPGFPKQVVMTITGAISALPESGNVECSLVCMDELEKVQTLRIAIYDTNGDIYLSSNSATFTEEYTALNIAANSTFGTVSFLNGLTIARHSANDSYTGVEGSGLKRSYGITIPRNGDGFYITSRENPEESVTFTFDIPYGIDLTNSSDYKLFVDSRLRSTAVKTDFEWIYMVQIPTNAPEWLSPIDNNTFNLNGVGGIASYDTYYTIPEAITRSDNHQMMVRLAPYTEQVAEVPNCNAFALYELDVILSKEVKDSAPAAVLIAAELNESTPWSAIDLAATYSNITSKVAKYGFIIDGEEYLNDGSISGNGTYKMTIEELADGTTFDDIKSVIYYEDTTTLLSLDILTMTTDVYIAPKIPTATILATPSNITCYSVTFDVDFTNVYNEGLTPIIKYYGADKEEISLDEQPILIEDGVQSYFFNGEAGLEAETEYTVELFLQTAMGAVYPTVSQSFTTTSVPSVKEDTFTLTPTIDGVTLSGLEYIHEEQIRRLSYKYKVASASSYSGIQYFTEPEETLTDTYSMSGLKEGTAYKFYWSIVTTNNQNKNNYKQIVASDKVYEFTTLSTMSITDYMAYDEAIMIDSNIHESASGITERGIVWSPAGDDEWIAIGSESESNDFSTFIEGLTAETEYDFKSYVKIEGEDEPRYSTIQTISTLPKQLSASLKDGIADKYNMTIITEVNEALNIEDITSYGVRYRVADSGEQFTDKITESQLDSYTFETLIDELVAETTYEIISFVVIDGYEYSSEAQQFSTISDAPIVMLSEQGEIGCYTASYTATMINIVNSEMTSYGYEYKLTSAAEYQSVEIGTDDLAAEQNYFTCALSELAHRSEYSVRAYVVIDGETTYSEAMSFTTLTPDPIVSIANSRSTASQIIVETSIENNYDIVSRGVAIDSTDYPYDGTDNPFTVTIPDLNYETTYSVKSYVVNEAGDRFESESTSVTTMAAPKLEGAIEYSGAISLSNGSDLTLKIPYTGSFDGATVTLSTTCEGLTISSADIATNSGYVTFEISGTPTTTAAGLVPFTLSSDALLSDKSFNVTTYDADGMATIIDNDKFSGEQSESLFKSGIDCIEYTFLNGMTIYRKSTNADPIGSEYGCFRFGNKNSGTYIVTIRPNDNGYIVSDTNNPEESVIFKVPVPVGVDLSKSTISTTVTGKNKAAGKTGSLWMSVSGDDMESWSFDTDHEFLIGGGVTNKSATFSNTLSNTPEYIYLRMSPSSTNMTYNDVVFIYDMKVKITPLE